MRNSGSLVVMLLLACVSNPSPAKAACEQFSGKYVLSAAACYYVNHGQQFPDSVYAGINISAVDSRSSLSMQYQRDAGDNGFTVAYIADGKEHAGDYYSSGKTYTASCDGTQIKSIRSGIFIAPIEMTFSKESDGTYTLTETVTATTPFVRSCSFVRVP